MSERRHAVLIGNGSFPEEPKLQALACPDRDVAALSELLLSPERGQFAGARKLIDEPHHRVTREIYDALNQVSRDDLLLIYYSGHGKLNRAGKLYLATSDTVLSALEATSVPVNTIREYLDVSACNKVVLILDCCFSGAAGDVFTKGGVEDQLQLASGGRGTYIMAASTGIQSAQEKQSDQYSVFTKHLIGGLSSGEADRDQDGFISVDELYDYVHRNVLQESPQEPTKWGLDVRGDLVIARSGRQPRVEREQRLRRLLLELASQDRIPDRILHAALELTKLPVEALTESQRRRDALLDQLSAQKLSPADFVLDWVQTEPRAETPSAERPADAAAGERDQALSAVRGPETAPRGADAPPRRAESSRTAPAGRRPAPGAAPLGSLPWKSLGLMLLGSVAASLVGAAATGIGAPLVMTAAASGFTVGVAIGWALRFVEGSIAWRTVLLIGVGWSLAALIHGYLGAYVGYGLVSAFVHWLVAGAVGGLTAWLVRPFVPRIRWRHVLIVAAGWTAAAVVGGLVAPAAVYFEALVYGFGFSPWFTLLSSSLNMLVGGGVMLWCLQRLRSQAPSPASP